MVCQIADELRMTTDMPTDCADCVYAPTCKVNQEVKRLCDGIYAMSVGPEEQARGIDPVQWIKTRLVHVEHYNEAVTQLGNKLDKANEENAELRVENQALLEALRDW